MTLDLDFINITRVTSNYKRVGPKKIDKLDTDIKKSKYQLEDYSYQLELI
ncbi:MAG: hypothetical protein ACPHY8_06085 [Patescibacteria group bacterium]